MIEAGELWLFAGNFSPFQAIIDNAPRLASAGMNWRFRAWRSRLRLGSALVMLAFVICHLTAHCLLLVSFEDAEATRNFLMYPWRTWIGTGILVTAFLVHYGNALWSIYIRRSLRLSRWEWAQLSLGLCANVVRHQFEDFVGQDDFVPTGSGKEMRPEGRVVCPLGFAPHQLRISFRVFA